LFDRFGYRFLPFCRRLRPFLATVFDRCFAVVAAVIGETDATGLPNGASRRFGRFLPFSIPLRDIGGADRATCRKDLSLSGRDRSFRSFRHRIEAKAISGNRQTP
jgi:hypothetical protein